MCAYVYPSVRMYLSAPCVRLSMLAFVCVNARVREGVCVIPSVRRFVCLSVRVRASKCLIVQACVPQCMLSCVCMHTCVRAYVWVRPSVRPSVCLSVRVHFRASKCMFTHTPSGTRACKNTNTRMLTCTHDALRYLRTDGLTHAHIFVRRQTPKYKHGS